MYTDMKALRKITEAEKYSAAWGGRIGSFNTYLLNLVRFIILAAVEMALHEGIYGLTCYERQNIIKNHCSRRNIGKEKS